MRHLALQSHTSCRTALYILNKFKEGNHSTILLVYDGSGVNKKINFTKEIVGGGLVLSARKCDRGRVTNKTLFLPEQSKVSEKTVFLPDHSRGRILYINVFTRHKSCLSFLYRGRVDKTWYLSSLDRRKMNKFQAMTSCLAHFPGKGNYQFTRITTTTTYVCFSIPYNIIGTK